MSGQEKQPEKELPANAGKAASSKSSPDISTSDKQASANKLTPEEQMALYEKDLKENDWGHQPC